MSPFGNLFLGAIPVELDHFAGSREIFPKTTEQTPFYGSRVFSGSRVFVI